MHEFLRWIYLLKFRFVKSQITLITAFALLNLLIGRLFQESLNIICFSELGAIALSSFVFWNIAANPLKKITKQWQLLKNPKQFLMHGGMGLSATLINILISQGLILVLMIYVYDCTSPSFTFINASLTNNIAVNLLCYFALIFHFLYKTENPVSTPQSANEPDDKIISFSSGGIKKIVPVDSIKFIETDNNCIVINTASGRYVKYQSLKSFLDEIQYQNIKRVHRSFAVNINHIDSVRKNKNGDGIITLHDEHQIKLSRNYRFEVIS